jgi:hypothetical protein
MSADFTYEQLLAVFEAAGRQYETNGDGEWEPPTPLVDWPEAYGQADNPAQWLTEPLLPDASSIAMYAKGGTGKSLLALWIAAGLATGNTLTGPAEPLEILYLDYEMTLATVVERLEDMGYDDPHTLKRFHYASLPTLAPLDTLEGGRAVVDLAIHLGVKLVVIDTFGRAVSGDENEADTVRNWFRWTGQLLKQAGIGFLRIDHAGKDATRGQRGSSAKNDDVDLVWEMTARDAGSYQLRATKRRFSWVEDTVTITQTRDNGILGYAWRDGTITYRAGAADLANILDNLDAPVDISRRKAIALLREAGHGRDNNVVSDALRYRRDQLNTTLQYHFPDNPPIPPTTPNTNPLHIPPAYHPIPPSQSGGQVVGMSLDIPPAPDPILEPSEDPLADF